MSKKQERPSLNSLWCVLLEENTNQYTMCPVHYYPHLQIGDYTNIKHKLVERTTLELCGSKYGLHLDY